jgi:hypothetical protein
VATRTLKMTKDKKEFFLSSVMGGGVVPPIQIEDSRGKIKI